MPRTVASGRKPGNRKASSSRRGFRIRVSCRICQPEEKGEAGPATRHNRERDVISTQWWVHTNTRRTKDEVRAFLSKLPGAGQSSEFPEHRDELVEYHGHALAKIHVPMSGGAKMNLPLYGFLETLCLVFNPVRGSDQTGFRETVYRVAFAFAGWDDACDIRFSQDDRGIFVRRGGHLLVNPRQFDTPSLRSLLPASFATADPPEEDLQKAGWPPVA
jgi:hypothetical protein